MIGDILKCIFAGIGVGFEALFKTIPLINQINGIKTEIIAVALGVPTFLITILSLIFKIIKKFFWKITFKKR